MPDRVVFGTLFASCVEEHLLHDVRAGLSEVIRIMGADSTYHDFLQALAFINTAIGVQPHAVPFASVSRHSDTQQATEFGVALYDSDPERVIDHFTIRLQGNKFVLTQRGVPHPRPDWLLSVDHVRDIARNPLRYLQNPALFDLEWLDRCVSEQTSSANQD